jgi:hypothetical protein
MTQISIPVIEDSEHHKLLKSVYSQRDKYANAIDEITLLGEGEKILKEQAVNLESVECWRPPRSMRSILDTISMLFRTKAQNLGPEDAFFVDLYRNGGALAVIFFRLIYLKPKQQKETLQKVIAWPSPTRQSFAELLLELVWPEKICAWVRTYDQTHNEKCL